MGNGFRHLGNLKFQQKSIDNLPLVPRRRRRRKCSRDFRCKFKVIPLCNMHKMRGSIYNLGTGDTSLTSVRNIKDFGYSTLAIPFTTLYIASLREPRIETQFLMSDREHGEPPGGRALQML